MAQYTATCGCGHKVDIQLYGPERERARKLAWMRSPKGMCNACYAASKRQDETEAEEARITAIVRQIEAHLDQMTPEVVAANRAECHAAVELGSGKAPEARRILAALDRLGI